MSGGPFYYQESLRSGSGTVSYRAVFRDYAAGSTTALPIQSGAVTIDGTQSTRRVARLTLAPVVTVNDRLTDVWDLLSAAVGEITVTAEWKYLDPARTTESIPMGVYVIDTDTIGMGPSGLNITALDRWELVRRTRFRLDRVSVPTNTTAQEIDRLMRGAFLGAIQFPGWAQFAADGATPVGPLLWQDGDRAKPILDMAAAQASQVGFDATGKPFLRPVPTLDGATPVFTVNSGADGILVSGERQRSRGQIRNQWLVSCSRDGAQLAPQLVENTNVLDPYRVSFYGPVVGYYSSPLFTSEAQMISAGRAKLAKQRGAASQLTVTAYPNYWLDADDVITVISPAADRSLPDVTSLHIIDRIEFPFGGPCQITTRTTGLVDES